MEGCVAKSVNQGFISAGNKCPKRRRREEERALLRSADALVPSPHTRQWSPSASYKSLSSSFIHATPHTSRRGHPKSSR